MKLPRFIAFALLSCGLLSECQTAAPAQQAVRSVIIQANTAAPAAVSGAYQWSANTSAYPQLTFPSGYTLLFSAPVTTSRTYTLPDASGPIVTSSGSVTSGHLATWASNGQIQDAGTSSGGGWLVATNNLSDVASVSASVANLGLTIGTNTQAYAANLTSLGAEGPSYYLARANQTGTQAWSTLTATPTSAAGYGIVNGSAIDSWGAKSVPSGTVVGTTDTQTLTNKTVTGYVPTSTEVNGQALTGNVTITTSGLGALAVSNNLGDLSNVGTARSNLGLGTAATASISTLLQSSNNLSELASEPTARGNLGLGSAATSSAAAFAPAWTGLTTGDVLVATGENTVAGTSTPTVSSLTIDGTPFPIVKLTAQDQSLYISGVENQGYAITSSIDGSGNVELDPASQGLDQVTLGFDGAGGLVIDTAGDISAAFTNLSDIGSQGNPWGNCWINGNLDLGGGGSITNGGNINSPAYWDSSGSLDSAPTPSVSQASGTVYTVTTTPAAITGGTSSPSFTAGATGHYVLLFGVQSSYNAATFSTAQTITYYLYRTNNSPGIIASSTTVSQLRAGTLITDGAGNPSATCLSYINSGDTIKIYAALSGSPGAGSVTVNAGTYLSAIFYY